jgi:predicted house-cleaning noncanonical NTP pyrophosphatase (MazG superfamily)
MLVHMVNLVFRSPSNTYTGGYMDKPESFLTPEERQEIHRKLREETEEMIRKPMNHVLSDTSTLISGLSLALNQASNQLEGVIVKHRKHLQDIRETLDNPNSEDKEKVNHALILVNLLLGDIL